MSKSDGAFEKAWFRTCKVHTNERFLFFRKCWKCEIKKKCKTISEVKLLLTFKPEIKHKLSQG